jgi:hypothetical protein
MRTTQSIDRHEVVKSDEIQECSQYSEPTTEWRVLRLLEILHPTESGLDDLPACLEPHCFAAPVGS